jgi:hypothetical protein
MTGSHVFDKREMIFSLGEGVDTFGVEKGQNLRDTGARQ